MFVEEEILVNAMSTEIGRKEIYLYPNALAEQMPPLIKEKYVGSTFFWQIFGLSFYAHLQGL